jgi:hypothetical protein
MIHQAEGSRSRRLQSVGKTTAAREDKAALKQVSAVPKSSSVW